MNKYFIYDSDGYGFYQYFNEGEQPANSYLKEGICTLKKPRFVNGELIETITSNELQTAKIENEYQLYLQRKDDGICAYLKISAELRLAKLGGQISDEEHRMIESELEPTRAEVVLGQWIGAKQKLEDAGSSIIGEAMYNDLMTRLENYITENY